MDLQELLDLIAIRSYVITVRENSAFDKPTVVGLGDTLLLLDKKIITILTSIEFKSYIGYSNVRQAREEVARNSNIKSGLKK